MSEATNILAAAHETAANRAAATPQVDYTALNQMVRRQRAALTRAVNSGDPDRVVVACRDAVREWNAPGAIWPDDWTRWQRALDDTLPLNAHVELSDLDCRPAPKHCDTESTPGAPGEDTQLTLLT